jgi:hypothetical protein
MKIDFDLTITLIDLFQYNVKMVERIAEFDDNIYVHQRAGRLCLTFNVKSRTLSKAIKKVLGKLQQIGFIDSDILRIENN